MTWDEIQSVRALSCAFFLSEAVVQIHDPDGCLVEEKVNDVYDVCMIRMMGVMCTTKTMVLCYVPSLSASRTASSVGPFRRQLDG